MLSKIFPTLPKVQNMPNAKIRSLEIFIYTIFTVRFYFIAAKDVFLPSYYHLHKFMNTLPKQYLSKIKYYITNTIKLIYIYKKVKKRQLGNLCMILKNK